MKSLLPILFFLMIISQSCTERVDIELDESFTRLVVYGALTTDSAVHYVELTKTTSYYYGETPPPVRNAVVEITEIAGDIVTLEEVSPGKYATPGNFRAVPGTTYNLEIELEEAINGFSHYSASTTVPYVYPIDSVRLRLITGWGPDSIYEVQCWYQDPPEANYYMFNIYKNGVLLTDTLNERFITDDLLYNGNYTNGIGVGFLNQSDDNERLNPNDTITFQGCNLTEEYFRFIYSLVQTTGFQSPLFSGPPANVKSNVSNGAVGFFTAYAVNYSSVVFQPGD